MATDMNMFVWIDNSRSSSVDRCEHESRELSLRTPVCYTTNRAALHQKPKDEALNNEVP